jgi:hypothetical protein
MCFEHNLDCHSAIMAEAGAERQLARPSGRRCVFAMRRVWLAIPGTLATSAP